MDKREEVTISLSEEHMELLRIVVGCGIVKSVDEAVGESLNLFKSLLHKYVKILDCECMVIDNSHDDEE